MGGGDRRKILRSRPPARRLQGCKDHEIFFEVIRDDARGPRGIESGTRCLPPLPESVQSVVAASGQLQPRALGPGNDIHADIAISSPEVPGPECRPRSIEVLGWQRAQLQMDRAPVILRVAQEMCATAADSHRVLCVNVQAVGQLLDGVRRWAAVLDPEL